MWVSSKETKRKQVTLAPAPAPAHKVITRKNTSIYSYEWCIDERSHVKCVCNRNESGGWMLSCQDTITLNIDDTVVHLLVVFICSYHTNREKERHSPNDTHTHTNKHIEMLHCTKLFMKTKINIILVFMCNLLLA